MKSFRPDEPRAGSGAPPQDMDPADTTNGRHFEERVTEEVESRMVFDKSRLITYALVVLVILVALYFVLPELTGLEDSLRKIEDADLVMFIYRDEYYNPETTEKQGTAEIHIAKHRNGPAGTHVELSFLSRFPKFANIARTDQPVIQPPGEGPPLQ